MDIKELKIGTFSEAKKEIEAVKASPPSVNLMAEKSIFKTIKINDMSTTAANILKQEMLSRGGEAAVSERTVNCKDKTTDVVLMGTLRQFREVSKKMRGQPLGLPDLGKWIEQMVSEEKKK
ncbi:hypothetical protein PRVXH_000453 [Proteinivorax hydrogeniformans]|uniref:BRCT domain-containing protein n=1 Tax=Proteinivorax hydrogeniformans TaxID=1826727 RepID=A0AAU8HUW4_9FIRM